MKEERVAKKCCLISLIKSENYGANLQGYSLYHFIRQHFPDLNVTVIDLLRPGQRGFRETADKATIKVSLLMRIRLSISSAFLFLRTFHSSIVRSSRFKHFTSSIDFTRTYHNSTELSRDYPNCDIYVTGSDQVWCPNREFDLMPYLLSFVKHSASKISYAPSMSTKRLTNEQVDRFKNALSDFAYISVREYSDKELLNHILPDREVSVVVDPVLLFPSDYWMRMCTPVSKKNYVLYYSIGPDEMLLDYSQRFCSKYQLELVYFRPQTNKTLYSRRYYSVNDAGPQELLGWIKNASAVVTNSYHGVLFSLLLRTPFMFNVAQYSSRFDTIESMFQLGKHKITNLDQILDWSSLSVSDESISLIQKASEMSQLYLTSSINNCL